jgi:hypothetical protein
MKKSSSPRRAERIRELLHRASSNADPRNKSGALKGPGRRAPPTTLPKLSTDAAKPHRLPAAPRALR